MSDLVTIKGCIIRHRTDKAIQIDIDGEIIWLPLSQVDYIRPKDHKAGQPVEIDITRWIADQKGLEYED